MGGYSVLVTNSIGSVTSVPAQLTVLPPPAFELDAINASGGTISISLQSGTNRNYTLQYKNSLSDPLWTPMLPSLSGTGGSIVLHDTNAVVSPARFYRVLAQ